jgi:two-component sensor histidine kinase
MGTTHLRTIWSTLVQALVDSEGQGVRARILLENIARETWLEACGLWRRESGPETWTCLLVRGSPERLHDRDFLEEVAAGRTPPDLVPGRGVLIAGQSAGALALTWAGAPPSDFELDLFAGLLHVARLVDAAEQRDSSERVEAFVPALPRSAEASGCQPALLLESLARAESEHCSRQRIAFRLDLEAGLEQCRVALPSSEFVRAVRNLVSNARDAMDSRQEGGQVELSLRQTTESQLVLAVEDTGPGLPKEVRDALLGRGPEELPGPGLGLAVSWGIALSAGGGMRVAQSSERGTRIEISLPVMRAS